MPEKQDCVCHYANDPAASVSFNVHILSKSPAELFTPICVFVGLRSHANLPCLVNLALDWLIYKAASYIYIYIYIYQTLTETCPSLLGDA